MPYQEFPRLISQEFDQSNIMGFSFAQDPEKSNYEENQCMGILANMQCRDSFVLQGYIGRLEGSFVVQGHFCCAGTLANQWVVLQCRDVHWHIGRYVVQEHFCSAGTYIGYVVQGHFCSAGTDTFDPLVVLQKRLHVYLFIFDLIWNESCSVDLSSLYVCF